MCCCSKSNYLTEEELNNMSLSQLNSYTYKIEKKLLSLDGVPEQIREAVKSDHGHIPEYQNKSLVIKKIMSIQEFIKITLAVNRSK
jgi:hypothetical protein